MPRWRRHARNWFEFAERLKLQGRFGEVLDGIIPTVSLDRVWHRDYQDQYYGATGQSWDQFIEGDPNIAGAAWHSVSLHNPTSTSPGALLELIVYRVTAVMRTESSAGINFVGPPAAAAPPGYSAINETLHLQTALESYFDNSGVATFTPSAVNVIGTRFGWLQPGVGPRDNDLRLPAAHLDCGVHDVQQVVSVNGVNNFAVGPAIGPIGQAGANWFQQASSRPFDLLAPSESPPIRLKPGQRLMVQSARPWASTLAAETNLQANFWWVERPYEGGGISK